MNIHNSVLELIGKTPLVRLNKITEGCHCTIVGKLESQNPGGSIKDRIGLAMIEDAEASGKLRPGGIIVEPTSGNTGIGLALAARLKGYKCIFVMSDKASQERVRYVKAMGAEVMIVPNAVKPDHPDYYMNAAKRLARELPNAVMLDQFNNKANPAAHYATTGPEIWEATEGKVTHFIAGMGTGGTITGTARYLKEKNPDIKIIGADPLGSAIKPFKDTGRLPESQPYLVEGVGQECIPGALDLSLVDEVISIPDRESFTIARRLAREEGIFCGGSSGLNVAVALRIGKLLPKDSLVVAIICDTGERYLTKHHSDEWLKEKNLLEQEYLSLRAVMEEKKAASALPLLVDISPSASVQEAVALMTKYELSELPVVENGALLGKVRENKLLALLIGDRALSNAQVVGVMEEAMPILDSHTDVKEAISLLKEQPSLMVSDYGRLVGIVTRHDVLRYV